MSANRKSDEKDLNGICRLCLTSNSELIDIFNNVDNCSLPLRIMACVALEITQSDSLPKNICRKCRYNLEKFYLFRKKSKNSDVKLRRYIRQLNSGKEANALDESDTEFEEEHASSITFLKNCQNEKDLESEKEEQEKVGRFNDALEEAIQLEQKRIREEESRRLDEIRNEFLIQESKKLDEEKRKFEEQKWKFEEEVRKFEEEKKKLWEEQEIELEERKKLLVEQQDVKLEIVKTNFVEEEKRKKDLDDAKSLIKVLKDGQIDSDAEMDEVEMFVEHDERDSPIPLEESDDAIEEDEVRCIESDSEENKEVHLIEEADMPVKDELNYRSSEFSGDDVDEDLDLASPDDSDYLMPSLALKQEDKNYEVEYLEDNSDGRDDFINLTNESTVINENLDLAEEYKMRKAAGEPTQILVRNQDGELICVEFIEDEDDGSKETKELIEEMDNSDTILEDRDNSGRLKVFACDKCPKRFSRRIQLHRHCAVHDQKQGWACTFCGKWFPSKSSQERHMRIHTGEKPFKCEVCNRAFIQKEILKRHMMVHTGIKPFSCEYCGKSFSQKEILRQHINKHHTAVPIISFHHCPQCPKSFHHASGLSRHLLVHRGRKFTCTVCGRPFNDKSALKRHINALHKENSIQVVKVE